MLTEGVNPSKSPENRTIQPSTRSGSVLPPGVSGALRDHGNAARTPFQLGPDELVEVAVEDSLGIAGLVPGTKVLDHRVGMHDVGADLAPEADALALAAALGRLGLAAVQLPCTRRARSSAIAVARFWVCERSFWHWTTILLGRWVIRTAESVLFTCCPPAPLAR